MAKEIISMRPHDGGINPNRDNIDKRESESKTSRTLDEDMSKLDEVRIDLNKTDHLSGEKHELDHKRIKLDNTKRENESHCQSVDSTYNEKKENLDKIVDSYIDDLKNRSEYPETIDDNAISSDKLEKRSPEENSKKREEFNEIKQDLKKEWEDRYGTEWPKYDEDVYSDNGKLIRKKGSDYDVHHIHPLSMGGENTVDNITPMHAKEHYDSQGVHSSTSPYSKLEKTLEEK